jgi:hypothetical protein
LAPVIVNTYGDADLAARPPGRCRRDPARANFKRADGNVFTNQPRHHLADPVRRRRREQHEASELFWGQLTHGSPCLVDVDSAFTPRTQLDSSRRPLDPN